MRSSKLLLLYFFVAESARLGGQPLTQTVPLISRSEREQRAYVQDFLDAGAPSGFRYFEGQKHEQMAAVRLLAASTNWAILMLEERTKVWMQIFDANRHSIENASSTIANAGGRRGLDAIIRLYNGRPELKKYIGRCLLTSDSLEPNRYVVWYYALDSSVPEVRRIASKVLAEMGNDRTPRALEIWAEAALDRYGHPPSPNEWWADPILSLAFETDPVRATENKTRLEVNVRDLVERRRNRTGGK
jgi:hypothetical protein